MICDKCGWNDNGTGDMAHTCATPKRSNPAFWGLGPDPLMITMPYTLTPEMLRTVRNHEDTRCDDKDEENRRIGWLICAWEVLIEARKSGAGN